jgi:hypothetical protein
MKKQKLWFIFCLVLIVAVTFAACSSNDDDHDKLSTKGNLTASDEQIKSTVAYLGTVPSYIRTAFDARFTNNAGAVTTGVKNLVVSSDALASDGETVYDCYRSGATIIVVHPDIDALSEWCSRHDVPFIGTILSGDGILIYAFNNKGASYSMDDPSAVDDDAQKRLNDYLNPFVSWVNQTNQGAPLSGSPPLSSNEPADIQKVFDYQTINHTFNMKLEKTLGTVLWSAPDIVTVTGQTSLKMTIYPLYAFEDQMAPGDYYVVNATTIVHNASMYKGHLTAKHGGVKVHMVAYIMDNLYLKFWMQDGIAVDFPASATPTPATTELSTTYTEGISWSLGGAVTGGVAAGAPTGTLTINAGVTVNNSTTRTTPDLIIHNLWQDAKVHYRYKVNNDALGYIQGYCSMHEPTAVISKANMEARNAWVWHVRGTKDRQTQSFTGTAYVSPTYTAMRCYSSVADSKWFDFDDAIEELQKYYTFRINPPNRVPTGRLQLKNTMGAGTYVTNIKLWKETTSISSKPDYSFDESIASGNEVVKNVEAAKYRVQIEAGPSASALKTYSTVKAVSITRGDVSVLNSGFDFQEGALK